MESTNTELSGRTAAVFSWVEFLAVMLIILSATAFRQYGDWLKLIALVMLLSNFIYRIAADWKAGRKKAVRYRLITFSLIILFLAVLIIWPNLRP
jgi:hypothetical protein